MPNGRAQLIVCRPDEKEHYKSLAKKTNRKVLDNCRDFEALRMLKDEVLIISEPYLTRGVDYRSATGAGLELLITFPQASKRQLRQLFGRVGRQDEPYGRYHLDSLKDDLVDRIQAALNLSKVKYYK